MTTPTLRDLMLAALDRIEVLESQAVVPVEAVEPAWAKAHAAEKDAARYRWLRETPPIHWPPQIYSDGALDEDGFDRVIDEEMKR